MHIHSMKGKLQWLKQQLQSSLVRLLQSLKRVIEASGLVARRAELDLTSNHEGSLVWKIRHFNIKRQQSISGQTPFITSPPFYKGGNGICHSVI